MTEPAPETAEPGTIKQHPDTRQTAVRTASLDPNRSWLIVDLVHGGAYSDGAECSYWPVVSTPAELD